MRIIIAGGGTGGHIFPGLALAEEFLGRDGQNQVLYVGAKGGLEETLLSKEKFPLKLIKSGKFAGEPWLDRVRSLGKLLIGIWQALVIIREFEPEFILGVGGYVSFPVLAAAFILRAPRGIHEQNSYPGLANRVLARISNRVFLSFDSARPHFKGVNQNKFVLAGNPLRKKLLAELAAPEENGKNSRFHILVVGGSQGARRLNKLMIDTVEYLVPVKDKLKIVHMSGSIDQYDLILSYTKNGIRAKVSSFISDMGTELKRADLVISRAGAGAVFEIALAGKPSLLIPYPFAANNHQFINAKYLVDNGAALMFNEDELKGGKRFAEAIKELMADPGRRAQMAALAKSLARAEAAGIIVDEIYKMAGARQ